MRENRFLTLWSFLLSLVLHAILTIVLIFSFGFSSTPILPPKPIANIVKAVTIDKKQVEKELNRIKDKEEKKKTDELNRKKELEKKAAEIKKKKEAKKKKLKDEKLRIKKLEKEKKALEKKKKEAEEKKRKEEERKKKAAEKKKIEKEKRKAKEEEERKAREKALQEELDAELEAEQEQHDKTEIRKYQDRIQRSIESKFNRLDLEEGLSCKILIRMSENGTVVKTSIVTPSGNTLFDGRAETAIHLASPLPVPDKPRIFEKMRDGIILTFE